MKYIDTPVWDKTFAPSEKVNHKKVTFKNRYGIQLVGDLYTPKDLKGTVSSTMCAFDTYDKEHRYNLRKQLNDKRTADLLAGSVNERSGGVPANLPDDAPDFMKDYRDYYKTERGFHPRSVNSNGGWEIIAELPFLTNSLLDHADEIRSAVLVIHGDKAYSLPASKDAFAKLTGDNKELLIIPGASHTDLYDQVDIIPFDKIVDFYNKNLK